MAAAPAASLVVKHTFLEYVEPSDGPLRARHFTDVPMSRRISSESTSLPESPDISEVEETSAGAAKAPVKEDPKANPKETPKDPKENPKENPKEAGKEKPKAGSTLAPTLLAECLSPNSSPWCGPVDQGYGPGANQNVWFDPLPPALPTWNESDWSGHWMANHMWSQGAAMNGGWLHDPMYGQTDLLAWMPDRLAQGGVLPHAAMMQDEYAHDHHTDKAADTTSAKQKATPSVGSDSAGMRTTVMLRNLPTGFSREMLLDLLDVEGFRGTYDFVYLPIDFSSGASLGYAFINLVSPIHADRFFQYFAGFSNWPHAVCDCVCSVSWSEPHQGLVQHVERYRSSPVMHVSVPDEWKPIILQDGARIPFPPPTKHIKAPKIRSRPAGNRQSQAAS